VAGDRLIVIMSPRRALLGLALLAAAPAASGAELALSYGHDVLGSGYADWRALSAEVAWVAGERTSIGLLARGLERFERQDLELGSSVAVPLGPRWRVAAEATGSPTHHAAPTWSGAVRVERALPEGFLASAGLKGSRYDSEVGGTYTGLGTVGVEWYRSVYRAAWTAYLSTVEGAWSVSNRVALDRFYGDENRIGLALSAGRELENVGARVVGTQVLAATASARHALGRGWAITGEVTFQRQGELYARAGGRLGLRRRF
jgi:YaiO family outer membrane protein